MRVDKLISMRTQFDEIMKNAYKIMENACGIVTDLSFYGSAPSLCSHILLLGRWGVWGGWPTFQKQAKVSVMCALVAFNFYAFFFLILASC